MRPKTTHEELLERLDALAVALQDVRAVQTCQNLFLHDLRGVVDQTAATVARLEKDVATLVANEAKEDALAFVSLRLERSDVGRSH